MKVIDLEEARTSKQAKVISGRERGKYWRRQFGIDRLDFSDEPVQVRIPQDVFSINLSFFLSLFGESVRRLGKEEFQKKYEFRCDPLLRPLIDQGIEQATKTSSILARAV